MRKAFLLLPFLLPVLCFAADTAPDWVRELSTRAIPAVPPETRTVTLLDEEHITVQQAGSANRQIRHAVRIVSRSGQDQSAAIPYIQKSTKIKDFRAWLISPSGSVKAYGKEAIVDRGVKQDFELYDELRVRFIESSGAEVGSTFAWTANYDDAELAPVEDFAFQESQPALIARLILTVPAGWQAKGVVFNHAPIEPSVEGSTYTWEMRDLPLIKKEPGSPNLDSLAPWIGVNYYPGAADGSVRAVRNWTDVSVLISSLADSQAQPDDALIAKTHELTAGASGPYEQIRQIGRYVQNIKYVEIATNLAHGGGMQPHPAAQVFAKQYGDCKDKANLMKTMLKVAGIDSYLVIIYSGDRDHVRPQWASPFQFNHAVIAIKVPDEVKSPAVLVHPVLGRLLIFDPTDSETPAGDLPEYEQGSYALLVAGNKGDIAQMPVAPPETNRADVKIEAAVAADGSLEASLADQCHGQSAARWRSIHANYDGAEFQKIIESWLSRSVKGMTLTKMDATDAFDQEQFAMRFDFKAQRYAQIMQRRLLVLLPGIVEQYERFPLQQEARVHPVVLDSRCYHKQVHLKLPPNFKVDEMPDPAALKSDFGKFTSTYKLDGQDLLYTEELDVNAAIIPAERYAEARRFFEAVAGAEQAPMVLLKN